MTDFILENLRLAGESGPQSLRIAQGRIVERGPGAGALEDDLPRRDCGGYLACAGFVDSHIHLDKALILDRCPICEGTLAEAVRLTATAKAAFTEEDVYTRAAALLERAVRHGTLVMRSFVEVDPRAGLRSFHALARLRADYADVIDLELCAFAQEGLTQEPQTLDLLHAALSEGADLLGGCPYTDSDPVAHVTQIFDLAERHGVAVDFHADFDLDPSGAILPEILSQTRARGMAGRVSVGHATKLGALPPDEVARIAAQMQAAGVALCVLPATDLFLNGRQPGPEGLRPRGLAPALALARAGVTVTLATNNVLNPFTPLGDGSLLRMAGLYANIAQLASDAEMAETFAMITDAPAALMGRDRALVPGAPADIVLLDAPDPAMAVRMGAPVRAVWKAGRLVLDQPRAEILRQR
ncbi:amidohydrolase family protein [Salipiger marinus]|jgi:cytosine deaminase|uniref:amidohydrolase family protein n=1 Tax=Salipiger marinus TaxID=555512 RepID=UPI000E7E33E5|nr:amidohydrolase family protein [Salipiger manganoxidans]MCD1616447.1 amidohydrolase family protein [Salipiger manganoxidans]MEB3419719.1 amidohydrolase family protein [Salipiger manganoxidans]HBM58583.1 amidohydrolase [Citreicella sp.]